MKKFKKIAVVGGGVFGCTAAWVLAKNGFKVDLYEKNNDIMTSASFVNQYRLHKGYHYPRSLETAASSKDSELSFLEAYGDSVYDSDTEQYYAISKRGSLVSALKYKNFLKKLGVSYKITELDILSKDSVSLIIKSSETVFDFKKLKFICAQELDNYNVNLHLNSDVKVQDLKDYDIVVNATYANLNHLLPVYDRKEYQFELCEKIIVSLPDQYKGKGVVIMDGPFMSIDPLKGTSYHVMGNVVHAIHESNTGVFPESSLQFQKLLNNGVISSPEISRFGHFLSSASEFFINIDKAKYIGSMYSYRTVLPDRDYDDARPTLVQQNSETMYSIFSGKIGTCVEAANELLDKIGATRVK